MVNIPLHYTLAQFAIETLTDVFPYALFRYDKTDVHITLLDRTIETGGGHFRVRIEPKKLTINLVVEAYEIGRFRVDSNNQNDIIGAISALVQDALTWSKTGRIKAWTRPLFTIWKPTTQLIDAFQVRIPNQPFYRPFHCITEKGLKTAHTYKGEKTYFWFPLDRWKNDDMLEEFHEIVPQEQYPELPRSIAEQLRLDIPLFFKAMK